MALTLYRHPGDQLACLRLLLLGRPVCRSWPTSYNIGGETEAVQDIGAPTNGHPQDRLVDIYFDQLSSSLAASPIHSTTSNSLPHLHSSLTPNSTLLGLMVERVNKLYAQVPYAERLQFIRLVTRPGERISTVKSALLQIATRFCPTT
ncbi:unnamed protein product [Protopolystoma xenopodis]|uniref:Uncharacterized protein n=1 Tax=Protopolystoma xenopodis TaxID=117903 RepID=A0A448X8Z4_9PLAT|nr:unnamed protein product [Protopolystoma xenopodis]